MQPEYTAYKDSPHSNVECVQCHIGPGAGWFVKSKLSGMGQVIAVTFNTYPRPIPTPVHNLRPARETCEACHWPQKYGEDRIKIVPKFAEDETNTLTKTVLLMKIGGGNHGVGIHGTHLGTGILIRYEHSDEQRQVIPRVTYIVNGKETVYATSDAKPEGAYGQPREMDCMDCHNRPAHAYDLPDRALDKSMNSGALSASLPFAKKKALEILKVNYKTRDEAAASIPAAFAKYGGIREILPGQLSRHLEPAPERSEGRRRGSARHLESQHLPGDERDLGPLPHEHRPHRFPGLLPLPRWQPRRQERRRHHPGLRRLRQSSRHG
ncbi:hypothetical protein SBA3_2550021 [Candidatus Sulfopaludibacter sp. SbA3]|nr:hypothetical protein SBA3_2550021 [Candidatus Sulfopaludibacter sp. SbA3]